LRATALLQQGNAAEAMVLLDGAAAALKRSQSADVVLLVEVPLLEANAAIALSRSADAHAFAEAGLKALAALPNPPHRLIALAAPLGAFKAGSR
jgi:hypothetical protein